MTRTHPFKRKALKLEGSRSSTLEVARGRLVFVSCVFVFFYMMVGARVVDLSVIQGELAHKGEPVMAASEAPPVKDAIRADITDRNGVILATSLETASLYADPSLIPEPELVARSLVEIFPQLSYGDVLQKLQRKGRFVWLERNITPAEQYEVLEMGQPGLGFRNEYRRIYPQQNMLSHIVGYTNVDGQGLAGIERSFDKLLDAGEPLALTIDVRLQHILRRELSGAIENFSAKGGAGVILDVGTGEILAAVSQPDFDPHEPGQAKPLQIFNNLTLGVFELGSIFKIFSTTALLDSGKADMATMFDAREPLKRGRFKISDYHPEERKLSLPEVFMYSSNIGSALMGEMVGTDGIKKFYEDLGLTVPLEIEIGEVGHPLIPHPWRDINTLTASYGHGIAVSPLQMTVAAASIVGGGSLIKPTLVYDEALATGHKKDTDTRELRIVSPQTAHRIRQLMRLVVTDGTGTNAEVPGYVVGGKTGTADKPSGKGYDRSKRISSFLGFFPMDAPRYAVLVMVDEPKGTKQSYGYATGGWVAAPAVGKIISAMVPVLNINPRIVEVDGDIATPLKKYVNFEEDGVASH